MTQARIVLLSKFLLVASVCLLTYSSVGLARIKWPQLMTERELRNELGRRKGFGGCERCGDRWDWKTSHCTQYEGGRALDVNGFIRSCGCFPLCEECWSALTQEQRLPFYMKLVDDWSRTKPPEDAAALESERAVIRAAVLAGK